MTTASSILALVAAAAIGAAPAWAGTTQYAYDSLGRLIQVTYPSGVTVAYSYDAAGNRTQVVKSAPNTQPRAVNDSASVIAGQIVDIQVRNNDADADGDTLTVTAVSAVTGGGTAAIMGGGTHVRFAAPATAGTKTFTYTVSDGHGGSATATVTVTVTAAPNVAPVASNDTASALTSAAVNILVRNNDTDANGDALTVTAVSAVSGGGTATIMSSGAHIRYTAPTSPGAKTFTYTVSDGRGGTDTATVTVNVAQANRAPVANNDTSSVETSAYVNIPVRSNDTDADGDTLTITAVSAVSGGGTAAIMSSGAHVRYTAPTSPGVKTFTYTVSDGRGGTDTATVTVNVVQANRAPVANNDTSSVETSAYVNIPVRSNDTDADGDPLTVTAVSAVSGGGTAVIMSSGAHVRYTAPTSPGTKTFTYTVSDGQGGTDTATVSVNVAQANRAPVAVNDSDTVGKLTSNNLYVLANDTDADNDPLTITAVSPPSGGTATIQGGGTHIQYTAPNINGGQTFTYTISDGQGGSSTATISLSVIGPSLGDDFCRKFPDKCQ